MTPRIGIFYGTNDGHTEDIAYRIQRLLDAVEPDLAVVFNIADALPEDIEAWETLIFGIPTWNIGQLQDDWEIFFPAFDDLNMTGQKVAIFGLGDQYGYSPTFIDAVGIVGKKVLARGGRLVGFWPAAGYEVEDSLAFVEGGRDTFLGLALDEDNEPHLTDARLAAWVGQVLAEFGLVEASGAG